MSTSVAAVPRPRTWLMYALLMSYGFAWAAARSDPVAQMMWLLGGVIVVVTVAYGLVMASRIAWALGALGVGAVIVKGVGRLIEGYEFWRLVHSGGLERVLGDRNELITDPLGPIATSLTALMILILPRTRTWVGGGRPNAFEVQTFIDAPADAIWPYVADPALGKRWNPSILASEITALDPGHLITTAWKSSAGVRATGTYRLIESETGTLVINTRTIEASGFRQVRMSLGRNRILKKLQATHNRLKRVVEDDLDAVRDA